MSDEMTPNQEICHNDAAYALGALSPRERREFEAHLATCPVCTQSLKTLSSTRAALSELPREDADVLLVRSQDDPVPPIPDVVLREVATLDEARRARLRRRTRGRLLTTAGVSALGGAAAAILAVTVIGAPSTPEPSVARSSSQESSGSPSKSVEGGPAGIATVDFRRMTDNNMLGSAELTTKEWGTSIHVKADYEGQSGRNGDSVLYYLYVVSDGKRELVGSWRGIIGKKCALTSATRFAPKDIDRLEIEMAPGERVLMEADVAMT